MAKRNTRSKTSKSEANLRDKIMKENLQPLIQPLLQRFFEVPIDSIEFIPVTKQQTTLEREPDFICKIFNAEFPQGTLLHIEFESAADPKMADRMLEYIAIERRRFGMSVMPFVIFVGTGNPNIPCEIREKGLHFSFPVFYVSQQPYTDFIQSEKGEEVLWAVMANFENTPPETVVHQIVLRLQQLYHHQPNQINKFLRQLRMLTQHRNLQPIIQQYFINMGLIFEIEKDIFFLQGMEKGQLKGKFEGQQLQNYVVAFNMFERDYDLETIADILEVSEQKVLEMKDEWQKMLQVQQVASETFQHQDQIARQFNIPTKQWEWLQKVENERRKR